MILEQLSKIRATAVRNLVKDKVYTVDYAIIKTDELNDAGKLLASDYEELMSYLAEKQTVEETTENVTEDTEVVEEVAEDNTEAVTEDNAEVVE